MRPWVALTQRVFTRSLRDLDLLLAIGTPVAFLVAVTVGLRKIIDTGDISYPQYVLPAVIVQSILLGALSAADRAAKDKSSGVTARLRTLPLKPVTLLMARVSYSVLRDTIGTISAVVVAYLLGFRFTGGIGHTVSFFAIALCLTAGLAMGADAVGSMSWELNDVTQLLLIPQLLLVVLSTGLAPAESFPDWVQRFVRYQPVSQISEALRDLTTGNIEMPKILVSIAWCVGILAVCGVVALRLQTRRP